MKIIDVYSQFLKTLKNKDLKLGEILQTTEDLQHLKKLAEEWEIDLQNVENWLRSPEYVKNRESAQRFIQIAQDVVKNVEHIFGQALPGEIKLSPSLMQFDGWARYDRGRHTVLFGVDHPDADEEYLKVLMAHELSHVYRDHQPQVWSFLGKPLVDIGRQEYLDNVSAEEHLASEGIATLFSQVVYPDAALHVHHFYIPEEMQWCLEHQDAIDKALKECLKSDQNPWRFYGDDVVAPGSPSRVQYFWAAKKIAEWLQQGRSMSREEFKNAVIKAHGLKATEYECFKV